MIRVRQSPNPAVESTFDRKSCSKKLPNKQHLKQQKNESSDPFSWHIVRKRSNLHIFLYIQPPYHHAGAMPTVPRKPDDKFGTEQSAIPESPISIDARSSGRCNVYATCCSFPSGIAHRARSGWRRTPIGFCSPHGAGLQRKDHVRGCNRPTSFANSNAVLTALETCNDEIFSGRSPPSVVLQRFSHKMSGTACAP